MKKFLIVAVLCILPIVLSVSAVPFERVPLENITVAGMEEPSILKPDEQVIVRTEYTTYYPNMEYTIIFQIKNEENQVVSLSWLDFQEDATVQTGTHVCGDEICYDKLALPESYICGDKICEGDPLGRKFAETSWLPSEPGKYEIVVFAWGNIDNPTALSPPIYVEVTVE